MQQIMKKEERGASQLLKQGKMYLHPLDYLRSTFEENRATIQEGFETISNEYKKQRIKLIAEIEAIIAALKEVYGKDITPEGQKQIQDLENQKKNVSGFGTSDNKQGTGDKTQELLDNLKSAFSGLADFDSVIAELQSELDSTNFDTAAEGARAAFERKLLEVAKEFANKQKPDEQIETKIAVALTNSANATAERMASEIAVVGEQQKQINLIRQQNELMLIQAKLREKHCKDKLN